jgi:hypothetical protein
MLTTEIWKDIPGYENLYQVSSLAQVRSIGRTLYSPSGIRLRTIPTKILAPVVDGGYYKVCLYSNGVRKSAKLHRIYAAAFVPGYFDGAHINHKDGNKLNNTLTNLEWCTPKNNVIHAVNTGLMNPTNNLPSKEKNRRFFKPVRNKITGEVFESIKAAADSAGIQPSFLSAVMRSPILNKTPFELIKATS